MFPKRITTNHPLWITSSWLILSRSFYNNDNFSHKRRAVQQEHYKFYDNLYTVRSIHTCIESKSNQQSHLARFVAQMSMANTLVLATISSFDKKSLGKDQQLESRGDCAPSVDTARRVEIWRSKAKKTATAAFPASNRIARLTCMRVPLNLLDARQTSFGRWEEWTRYKERESSRQRNQWRKQEATKNGETEKERSS